MALECKCCQKKEIQNINSKHGSDDESLFWLLSMVFEKYSKKKIRIFLNQFWSAEKNTIDVFVYEAVQNVFIGYLNQNSMKKIISTILQADSSQQPNRNCSDLTLRQFSKNDVIRASWFEELQRKMQKIASKWLKYSNCHVNRIENGYFSEYFHGTWDHMKSRELNPFIWSSNGQNHILLHFHWMFKPIQIICNIANSWHTICSQIAKVTEKCWPQQWRKYWKHVHSYNA